MKRIFIISKELLENAADNEEEKLQLNLEYFYHPGKDKPVLFITNKEKVMMEVLQYSEPCRSWFIGNELSSDGNIYVTTPIDSTFLALYHLRKHCSQNAMSLDSIYDSNDPSLSRLMREFIEPKNLKSVADVHVYDDTEYFKYNHQKTLAWLSLKTERMARCLRERGVYCGRSASSSHYVQSDKYKEDCNRETEEDFLRMACDYVGDYISIDLHDNLIEYLNIPPEKPMPASNKRKSGTAPNNDKQKRIKLEDDNDDFKPENACPSPFLEPIVEVKERTLSTKEKTLAKAAKGSRSITGFFQKKAVK